MATNEANEVMTVPELAEYLRMADSIVYRMAKTGIFQVERSEGVGGFREGLLMSGWRFLLKVKPE